MQNMDFTGEMTLETQKDQNGKRENCNDFTLHGLCGLLVLENRRENTDLSAKAS